MSPIGRAGAPAGREDTVRGAPPPGPASSATVPQAWHSPHRPTHLAVVHPHSAQRYPFDGVRERERAVAVVTRGTVSARTDIGTLPGDATVDGGDDGGRRGPAARA